jgi:hypothetical protein
MGFSLSWIAIHGVPLETVLTRLNLARTGEYAEYARAAVSGQPLNRDWYLMVARGCDHEIVRPATLAGLSEEAEVVACSVEEHVMFASAERWQLGTRLWRVEHDAQQGIRHLEAAGTLPGSYEAVCERYREQQDAEDAGDKEVDCYFEIPLNLAKALADFKHDEVHTSLADNGYEVFRSLKSAKRWWQWW